MPLQPDEMLGPYKILGLLGEGGMGAVYRARDTRLHRDVAIKVLTAITLNDQERLQRFEQEARATGMLNHPNLLTIFDVGSHEGTPFLVGELLEGETLSNRLLRGPMPPRKAIECASQMAQGLAAAHEKGVVHRDLKPDNIFITREGRVKILDFGIAKLNPKSGAEGPTFQMAATEPGMVLGTVGYMSPEQVRGEAVDERSDIFSFGTILYEMLTGERAFKRNSSIETLSAILKEEPPDLADRLPNIPPSLERLVRRCLEKNRELRFQSARDLAFNLETMSSMSMPSTLASGLAQPQSGSNISPTVRTSTPTAHKPLTSTVSVPGTKAHPTTARPRTSFTRPKPRVSPLLLGLLFLVAIAGAAFGGWWYATHSSAEQPEAVFRRITFRRGEIRGARFTPDGDTIVYSAAWEGQPSSIFVASRQSPEARPLGINDAEVEAVSKSTELAIMLRRDRLTGIGTLARIPLAGGMPREIADSVLRADWMPNGTDLAIVRYTNGKYRVEAPIGNLQYDTARPITAMRVAPDGRIAFIEQVTGKDMLSLIVNKKVDPIAAGWSHGTTGMVWHPNGKELWLTGTDSAAPPSLYSVTVDGNVRLVHRLTGSMKLYDVSSAGRFLLTSGNWRAALQYQAPGETTEHDVSWLDWSIAADLSPDGKTILFNETREGGGDRKGIYIRRSDAPAPVRIGDGAGDGLSPDGKWVLCHNGGKLVILPTGTGEARELKVTGPFDYGAAWMPDSRRVVIGGNLQGKGYQLHLIDTLDETSTPITPEGIWGDATRPFAVSPDGRFVAGMTAQQTLALYSVDGSAQPMPIAAAEKGEVPITFSNDGALLYVYRPTAVPGEIVRITLATGLREPWKQFAPADPGGVYKISPVFITPDATAYVYDALRTTSDLYVAEGLR